MLMRAEPKTRKPMTTASQSSFNRARSAIGAETLTAISDIRLPQIQLATSRRRNPHQFGCNMVRKAEQRQSHRILLLAGFQQRSSRKMRLGRMNDCGSDKAP